MLNVMENQRDRYSTREEKFQVFVNVYNHVEEVESLKQITLVGLKW